MPTDAFSVVDDLPQPSPKQRQKQRNSGRKNESLMALQYCISNAGTWCKLFMYEYKDGHNYRTGDTGSRNCAYGNCHNRRASLKKLAEEHGVAIEVHFHDDSEQKEITVYACVTTKEA